MISIQIVPETCRQAHLKAPVMPMQASLSSVVNATVKPLTEDIFDLAQF